VKAVADAVAEMIEAKTKNGASAVYLADLRYRLGGLAEAFHCNVNAITQDALRAYLDGLTFAPCGFNNQHAIIGTFFAYAQSRDWLSKDVDWLAGIERRKAKAVPVEIFTPAEMAEILTHCTPELRPCLALAAFAGLRQEEILRIVAFQSATLIQREPGVSGTEKRVASATGCRSFVKRASTSKKESNSIEPWRRSMIRKVPMGASSSARVAKSRVVFGASSKESRACAGSVKYF
jgi:hypothetical protein